MAHSPVVKVILVVAAALLVAPAAMAGTFLHAKALDPAASYVAKKPVQVMCAKSDAAWNSFMVATYGENDGAHGSTVPGSSVTRLDYTVCSYVLERLAGYSVPDASLAPSIEVLTHESIHARGESSEGVTDCDAVHEMPGVAVRFFKIKAGKQLRALMAAAWTWRDELQPSYRSVC